jgi:hypothetical protein
MTRAEFVQHGVLTLITRVTSLSGENDEERAARVVRLTVGLADILEKSGAAPWIQSPAKPGALRADTRDARLECQEVASFLRFLGLDAVAARIEAGEHHTAYRGAT